MSLYVILIIQRVSPKCLSPLTSGIRAHGDVGKIWQGYQVPLTVGAGTGYVYLMPFCSWSKDDILQQASP